MRRWATGAAGAAILAIVVSALASAVAAGAFPVIVPDAAGSRLLLRTQPKRIVSLVPSVTEILFALGLDREVVGISDADDYPPHMVNGRARVGGVTLNYERIVALRPDLIIGMRSLQRDQLTRLRSLQLPVLGVEAESIDETAALIRLVGTATGRKRHAEDLAVTLERRARAVKPAGRISVYIELWDEPAMTAGRGT